MKSNSKTWELKCWPEFFEEIIAENKTHDLRRCNDRSFKIGDIINLQEYNPKNNSYTGRDAFVKITYITEKISPCAYSEEALKPGFCILSIKVIK